MPSIRDQAVVLRRLDYSETSQVIVLFTREHGKVRAIAKGIKRGTKKRFAVGIDLLDVGHVTVSYREERSAALATVTEWKQTRSLSGLREKLTRIQAAEYVAEVTAHLTVDWDPHSELFDALIQALVATADAANPLGIVVEYQLRLLDSIGSLPRFDACISCGRVDDLTHFTSFDGGMICRSCEAGKIEKYEVTPVALSTIRGMLDMMAGAVEGASTSPAADQDAARQDAPGVFAVLNYHIAHMMGRQPRLASKLSPQRRST